MLWYKAWLETRLRFLICLVGITAICAWSVFSDVYRLAPDVELEYYYSVLFMIHGRLVMMWLLAVTLITLGGLLREKAVGAVSFTLALPFSRARLTLVRMAVAVIQCIALIVIPWSAIFLTSSICGKADSMSQALFYVALLTGGGTVFFAIGTLVSSLVEGEYTAPAVTFGAVLLIAAQLSSHFLWQYNPMGFILGMKFHGAQTSLLIGPMPWMQIGAYVLLAVLLVTVAVKAIQVREF